MDKIKLAIKWFEINLKYYLSFIFFLDHNDKKKY